MKKSTTYSFLALTLLMLFTGCQQELEPDQPYKSAGDLVFYVENENNVETKTTLAGDKFSVNFNTGDKIAVFDGTNKITYSSESTGATATFTKTAGNDPAESQAYYAAYPYNGDVVLNGEKKIANVTIPAVQSAPRNSFDPNANVSVAKAALVSKNVSGATYKLTFLNVGNLVKFTFTEDSNVSAIVIKCNANQNLVGTVTVDPTTGVFDPNSLSNGSTSITLKPEGSDYFLTGDYYAVMLPQVHKRGISVKMEHTSGSYHFKRGGVANLTMERNKIYNIYSSEDLKKYTEAAVLPSLYKQDGTINKNGETYKNLKSATRISFHAMAIEANWNYADVHNDLHIMGDSDVRGYLNSDGTLHIYTKKGMFAVPEADTQTDTNDGTHMFEGYANVTAIDNLSYLDVTFLHSFLNFFRGCEKLAIIDISGWDTSAATNMNGLFNTSITSALRNVILGEYFHLENPGNNMFGASGGSARDDDKKIRVSCPESVYSQFEGISYQAGNEMYQKFVTWNYGPSATTFGEFLNPSIMVVSVDREVNFTFTLGGFFDTSSLSEITIGLDGYAPLPGNAQMTLTGAENIDGVDYNMYTLSLSEAQKNDRRVILPLKAQSTELNPSHAILRANNFPDAKVTSRIYAEPFKGEVDWDKTVGHANFISGLAENDWKDYSGENWPIAGQSCYVQFYLKSNYSVDGVMLSNGTDSFECDEIGNHSEPGFKIYKTHDPILVSKTGGKIDLDVLVQVEGQRMLHKAGVVSVDVYDITLAPITEVPSSFNTSSVFVLKNTDTGRYLWRKDNKNNSYVGTLDVINNFCFWQFNDGNPAQAKLKTYNTSTAHCLRAADQLNASSYYSFKVIKGKSGLKFGNSGSTSFLRDQTTASNKTASCALSGTANQNEWIVYEVTFTAPAVP